MHGRCPIRVANILYYLVFYIMLFSLYKIKKGTTTGRRSQHRPVIGSGEDFQTVRPESGNSF